MAELSSSISWLESLSVKTSVLDSKSAPVHARSPVSSLGQSAELGQSIVQDLV